MNSLLNAYGHSDDENDNDNDNDNNNDANDDANEIRLTFNEDGARTTRADESSSARPSRADVAPPVSESAARSLALSSSMAKSGALLSSRAVSMRANVRAELLAQSDVGAAHPLQRDALVAGVKNTLTGFVEEHAMHAVQFQSNFERDRRRLGRSDAELDAALKARAKPEKRSRGDISGAWWGSWAPPDDVADVADAPPDSLDVAAAAAASALPLTDEQAAAIDARNEARKKARVADAKTKAAAAAAGAERSVFHGKTLADYQGRTYIWPPSDLKPHEHKCYLPKKLVHTFAGHTKGVNRVRYFPTYGHLLLSASMDATLKIWDLRRDQERQCLRTMYGHAQAVREVAFNGDGKTFLSCGYDKLVRHWDTETGQCLARLGGSVMSFCAQYYALDENLVLAGGSDYKICQWDMRANAIVQTYNEHQGAVNTITFFDQNRRFMSTSDDKKIFLWEFGIPVVIKHISDPEMHAVPAVASHPSGKYVACQNLNNTITVYECADGTMRSKSKTFRGHITAGYACDVAISPDGQFVVSGDGNGQCVFWDWKKTTLYAKLKCHEGVAISCQWNPIEPSQLATGGWDGAIKIWT